MLRQEENGILLRVLNMKGSVGAQSSKAMEAHQEDAVS